MRNPSSGLPNDVHQLPDPADLASNDISFIQELRRIHPHRHAARRSGRNDCSRLQRHSLLTPKASFPMTTPKLNLVIQAVDEGVLRYFATGVVGAVHSFGKIDRVLLFREAEPLRHVTHVGAVVDAGEE